MDRIRSLRRRSYLLGGALAAGLLVVLLRATGETEAVATKSLPATFPGIDVTKVRAVELERTVTRDGKPTKTSLRLERTGAAAWAVATSDGYAADPKKVEDWIRSLADIRTKSEVTSTPAKFAGFAGTDGFTDVRLYEDGEAPSLSFGIGKGNAEGSWSNTFLRIDDVAKRTKGRPAAEGAAGGRIVAATGIDSFGDRTELTGWIEARLFPGLNDADVTALAWTHAPKTFEGKLLRGPKGEKDTDEPWLLELPAPGGKAKQESAKQVVSALTGLRLATLEGRAGPDVDAKYGFDKPDLVVIATGKASGPGKPAPVYKVEIGKKVDGKSTWYARRSLLTGPDAWVYTVNEYDVSRWRDDPKDLFESKPTPPTPAAMDETPPMGEMPPAMDETPPMGEMPPAMGEAPPTPPAMDEPAPPMGETPPMGEMPPAMGEAPPTPPAMDEPAPPMGEAPPGPAK